MLAVIVGVAIETLVGAAVADTVFTGISVDTLQAAKKNSRQTIHPNLDFMT